MTTTPIQPLGQPSSQPSTPNVRSARDDASTRPGGPSGSTNPSTPTVGAKPASNAGSRDEGTRSFRTNPEAGASSQGRDAGSAETLRLLDSIEENLGKLRSALGASSRQGSNKPSDRPSSDSPTRTSHTEDGERNAPGGDRTRNMPSGS